MAKKQKYQEGSWFAVQLEADKFLIGVIARKSKSILLVYFFDKNFSAIPNISRLENFKPTDAIKVIQVGDLGLYKGEWKVIGELPDWNRSLWTIPNFVRREPFTNRIWLVEYNDDNPNQIISETLVTEKEVKNVETDGLFGYKAAVKQLLKLFEKQ